MQIEFRAWDPVKHEMFYFDEFFVPGNRLPPLTGWGKMIPMQWTGLFDSRKKKIYVGDIFAKFGGNIDKPDEYEAHGIVYFDDDFAAYCVKLCNGGWIFLHEYLSITSFSKEVQGNKYENVDLVI